MKIERKIHHIWKEAIRLKKPHENIILPITIGKWNYIYTSNKGQISLINLLDYFPHNKYIWEIYSLKGNLFEDVEKFTTKKEAELKIKQLLED